MLARFKQFSSGIFGIFKRKNREVSATEENFEQITPKQIPSAKICVELFLKELAQLSVSQSTLRNYSSDILQFIDFSNDNNVKTLLTEPHFKAFFADQQMKGLKSSSIQRKIVSLKLFSQWVEKNYLSAQPEAKKEVIVPLIVNSGNSNGSSSQPLHSAADSSSATVQDKKGYQDWILGPYFHLATLIIFFIFISILWYRQFFVTVPEKLAYPATPVSPDRILSFQARLTDVAGTPITTATNTTFKLYDASSGGNLLWNSGTCSIDPDQDGIFSTILGSTCGSAIPATVFTENSQVWLEITVVSDVLTPRQRIATVPYALNSETIQGFPVNSTASATKSTVLVMNQWGEVLLGERSPLLKSVSGTFTISGSTLNLVTNSGSNGNIVLDPDGTGTINLNGNVLNDGYLFTHGATISATYAGNTPLTINGTGGQVLTVNNAGDVTTAGDVAVNGGDITSTGDITISPTGNNVLFSDNTVLNIGGAAAQAYNFFADSTAGNSTATGDNDVYIQDILEVDGAARFDSSVTLSTLNTAGGIVYTNGSGQLLTSTAGSSGDCLQSGGTGAPTWGTCSSGGLAGTWRIANGATSPVNDTLDLLIGSNATSSAKFAVINVNSGTPTASLSAGVAGGAYLTATGTLQTTANQALAIGGNTTGDISFSPLNGTGTSTFTGNLTQSGGIVNLNVSSNNAVNIATGTSTGTVTVGGTGTQTINVGNGAGNKTVNLGSNNGGSTTAILSGTGGLSLNSTSSDIALQTNTSGNITATTATGNGLLNVLTGNLKVGNGTPDVTLNGEDAYIEGTLETDGAVRFDNSSITLSSFTNNGGMLYTNGSGVLAQTTAGSAGQCLQGGTTPGFVDCTTIGSYWRLASGALSPINDTADLLVGANATTSAKFAVINVNSGTPTATLSAGVAGGSYLTAAGTLQTTANQTLTLGGSTTGDVAISPLNGAGGVNVNVGASRLLNVLTGNLKVGNGTPDVTQDGEDAYIEGTLEVDGAVRFDNSAVRLSAFTTNGGLLYTDGSGNIGQSTAGTAGQCLVSNGGGAPGWTSCSSGATNFWRLANGALSPVNDTLDLLIGNTATTSARFAVINVNSGTPTATLSAGVAGGAFLTADGSLQTTANQTLTLGGLTTGDIAISPLNGAGGVNVNLGATRLFNILSGNLKVGNGTPDVTQDGEDAYIEGSLEVDGAVRFDNSSIRMSTFTTDGGILYTNATGVLAQTTAGLSGQCLKSNGSGAPTFGTCATDNFWRINNGAISPVNDTLDLLIGNTATTSARFAVINVNSGTPTATLSAGVTGGAYLSATGTLQTTANQALAIGGNTTGDISFSPLNGTGTSTFTGNLTQSGGIVNLNVSSNNAVNIGTGSSTGTVTVGGTGTQTIAVGNGAGNKTVNLGSNNGGSTTAILSGTGGLSLNSTSSDIALQTNTSGNITATTAVGTGLFNVLTGNLKVGNGAPSNALSGESAYIEGGLEADGAVRFDNSSITFSTFTQNGGMLYTNGSGVLAQTTAGSAGQCLQGGTTPTFVTCTSIGSNWRIASGAISPNNDTLDLLIGANATTSAKFAVINVNSGTPTATLSAGIAGGSYLTATGSLQTTANQTLTLGGSTTGDVAISPLNGAGGVNVNLGATRTLNVLTGNLKVGNGNPDVAQDGEDAYIEGTLEVDGAVRFDNSSITMSTFTNNGGIIYTNASGVLAQTTVGSNGQCLQSVGGGTPTWGTCGSLINYWRIANGALSPVNDTLDLLVGNTATTSAKFAVINVNSGTPTATLSAGITGGAYLNASGALQTTDNQTLTLGGSTTGDIALSPANAGGGVNVNVGATRSLNVLAGNLKVGNGNPDVSLNGEDAYIEGTLEVDSASRFDSTVQISSLTTDGGVLYTNSSGVISQTTVGTGGQCLQSNGGGAPTWGSCTGGAVNYMRIVSGAISPVNDTVDFLVGNVASTSAKFAVLNVNSGTPTASLSAGVAGGAYLSATGTLQTTANQALAIGGNTTGDISFSPLNGTGTSTFTGNLTQSGGIVNLNVSSNNAVNLGTGSSTGTVTVGGTGTQTISVGNGAGNKTVNLGSNNTGSTTAILSGTGGLSLNSTSSNIALQTNTSGDITETTAASTGLVNVLTGNLKVGNGAPTNTLSGESAYIEGGLEVDGAVRFDNSSITMSTFTQNGGILYTNGSGVLAQTTAGSAGQCLQGGTTPSFVACTSISSYWRLASGALSPINDTTDLLVGSNATTSAKFAVINVNSGTPTASLSAGAAGGAYLTAAGSLQTTASQTLTLGGSTTGDIALSPVNGTGSINANIGASLLLNILTGNLKVGNGTPDVTLNGEDAYIEGTFEVDGTSRFDGAATFNAGATVASGQTLTLAGLTSNGGVLYTNGSGVVSQVTAGSAGQCLQGGTTPSFVSCTSISSYWRLANGALSPINDTLDLLIGNTATTSAKFAVINVNSGTPTATLSAGAAGGAYLTATGSLQTTANQALAIGGSTTGDISLSPLNGQGGVTIASSLATAARSTDLVTLSQANDGTRDSTGNLLQLTNSDSGSTAAALNINQVTSGTSIEIVGSGTGTGINWNVGISSGTAAQIFGGSLTSGKGLDIQGGATNAAFSGALIRGVINRTATTSVTESGNYLLLDRSNNQINNAGQTLTVTGDVARFISKCTETAGTCTDTGNVLELDQQYANATGAVLNLLNSGTGQGIKLTSSSTGDLAELDASGAGTTANGLLIQQTGAGTLTDAIDVSDETITNALNVGANTITGAGYLVTSTASGLTINSTSADLALQTTTSGNITQTVGATALVNILTGNLKVGNASPTTAQDGEDAYIEGMLEVDGAIRFDASAGNISMTAFTSNGGLLYTNASGVLAQTAVGNSGECLTSVGGGTPVWASCSASSGNLWRLSSGAFSPVNDTADLLVGANATTSAKFAVINVNSGTPTATLSAGVAGGAYLTAAGTLQTTANQSLTLGGNTTGNITLSPKSGAGAITLDENTITTTNGVTLNANALTTGAAFIIPHTTSVIANGGSLMRLSSTSVDTTTTTGALLDLSSSASTAGTQFLQTYSGLTTGIADSLVLNALTTGTGIGVTSSSTGITTAAVNTGSLFDITESGAMTGMTGSLASINASGANTVGSTGNLLNLNIAGSAQIMKVLNITDATTGALTNGAVRVNMTGAHTGNAVEIDDVTTTGKALQITDTAAYTGTGLVALTADSATSGVLSTISGNALTTGTAFGINSSSTGITAAAVNTGSLFDITESGAMTGMTGSLASINASGANTVGSTGNLLNLNIAGSAQIMKVLNITDATTGALVNGAVRLNMTGAHTGNALQIDDVTTGGNAVQITASSLTGGNALSITGSTAQTTGASLAVTNGRVSFTPTNTIASGASAVWNGVTIPATTATLTGTTQVTTSTGFNLFNIGQPTLTDGSAVTVDNAATLYIANAPAAAGSVTLTNPYALWIDAGALRFDGALNVNGSVGTGSQCLLGGATPAWGACGSSSGSNWRITNGALSPINDTLDLLIGNTATTSAKFAVINVNSGTPTATLSAGVAGGAYLTATGTLQTTANQSLTLGGSTTGNITISPKSGAGAITLDENTITTTNGVTLNANALTTGAAFIIPHTTSVIANGGSLMRLSSTSADTSTTTGALLDLSSSASTAGTQILQTYSGLTTGIGESMVVNALTTGTGLGITSSSTGLSSAAVNTGSLFDITESGAMTGMTGSLASINASGANTVGSTGNLLNLNVSGSAQIMKVLNIVDATTGALVNGAVRLNMTGAHTGNALQIDDVTTTGKVELITANSLTTGTGLGISSSATGITTAASNTGSLFDITASGANTGITGSIASINASSVNNVGNTGNLLNLNLSGAANIMKALNIADNSTGALTGGGIFLNMTGAHTGTAAEIDDVTTTGTLFKLANSASGQTTDKFIDISQTGVTTGYTGNLINLSTTGTTGAATFINMTADASTVGTGEKISMNALTTGTIYSGATSSTAITTAGSNVGSLLDLTASGAMTAFTGSLANINVANANNVGDTGNALNINLGSAAQIMKAVNITDATTGALTNGAFRLNMTGAHTGNGMEIDDVTTTGTAFQLTGTGVYTGTAFAGITQDAATTGTVFLMSEDGLTSGTGFSNTSTSTVLTSGKLASFDWSPPASTTIYATTGSALLNLNVGQYGVIDKILNASDNASDVFTVRQNKITNALPTEFTAAGDVSVAYDIQMTNQTASTIKSNAGLTVQAGESFENNNLTLSTYGTGQITLDGSFNGGAVTDAATVSTSGTTRTVSGRGSVYYLSADSTTTDLSITTTFNITGVPDTNGTVIFISSRAIKGVTAGVRQDTVNININGTSLSSVQTASGTAASTVIENYVAARMNGTWRIVGSTGTADSADYAEFYKVTQQLESGSIVALSPTDPTTVNEATSADGSRTIGITSTSPAYNIGDEWQDQQKAPIALAGRVPVRISANSQAIKIGDPIAASDLAGQGTKATRAGFIVGRALEDWTPGSGVDRINVFVNPVYYDPGYLVDEVGNIQDRTTALEAKLAENTDIMNKISSPAYDSNGQATNNFSIVNVGGIFQVVTNSTNTVVNQLIAGSRAVFGQLEAGTIKTNSVKTSLISPISSEDLTLKLGTEASSKLSVKNASDEAVLNIDQQGNTDIAGNVTTQGNLEVAQDASVEGQVTAKSGRFEQLQAQKATLENLDVQSATISGQLYLSDGRSIQGIIDDNSNYIASLSAQTEAITQQVQSAPQALTTSSFDQFLSQLTGSQDASVSAAINALAQQQNITLQSTDMVLAPDAVFVKEFLNVAGYAQFNNANVSLSLTIGNNLLLTQDSIASAGQTLNIQPTATNSVNILAGLLVLNPDGNVVLNGNLVVSGDVKVGQKLNTNAIQPNDYSSDFTLKLATQSAVLGASTESKFSILDASNGSVASIDASGSARFNDVSASGLTIQNPTLSATDSASIAEKAKNQTVGSNTLPAGTTELTIDNNNVNDNVLIYLTPTSDTANQVVYLKSKETCNGPLSLASCQKSFTVSIKNAVTQDISFNYWIVKTK